MSGTSETATSHLNQEETDKLISHLVYSDVTDVAVARAMKKLDDIESGAGELPEDWRPHCGKCGEEIEDNEMAGTAFGSFYHDGCVPSLDKGPMPVGQLLGGVDDVL